MRSRSVCALRVAADFGTSCSPNPISLLLPTHSRRPSPPHKPIPHSVICSSGLTRDTFVSVFLTFFHVLRQTMSSAGPSRPRVVTLTADQLLGTSLTPARAHNKHKNSNTPRVLTIEDLLGPGLTVARPASRPTPTRTAPRPTPRPSSSRGSGSSSTRTAPNPRLVRVTADEVLRTGIPVRTLQAVKARSQVLSAEELLAATSSRSSVRTTPQARGRTTAAQPSGGSSSPGSSGSRSAAGVGAGRTTGNASTAGSHETRQTAQQAGRDNGASGASTQGRNPRSGPPRRSLSLGSMRTLPIYTQEPGDSETVIDR